jgi:hypothetical protein
MPSTIWKSFLPWPSRTFFERPGLFQQAQPELYLILAKLFKQDPVTLYASRPSTETFISLKSTLKFSRPQTALMCLIRIPNEIILQGSRRAVLASSPKCFGLRIINGQLLSKSILRLLPARRLLTVKRGVSFISFYRGGVQTNVVRLIGKFKQKFLSIGGKFEVLDASERSLCMLKGKWTSWDFRVRESNDGKEFATGYEKVEWFGQRTISHLPIIMFCRSVQRCACR